MSVTKCILLDKRLEDCLAGVFPDSDSRIRHADTESAPAVILRLESHSQGNGAVFGEFYSVAEQVEEYLPQPQAVQFQDRQAGGDLLTVIEVLFAYLFAENCRDLMKQFRKIGRGRDDFRLFRFQL